MAFRNFLVCDDVREELGNRKSIMGVLSGDILVDQIPATLQIAIFGEYIKETDDEETVELKLFQDDQQIAQAMIHVAVGPRNNPGMVVLPRALIQFEKECDFIILGMTAKGETVELVRKRVMKRT